MIPAQGKNECPVRYKTTTGMNLLVGGGVAIF